jgi:hypothetical protein
MLFSTISQPLPKCVFALHYAAVLALFLQTGIFNFISFFLDFRHVRKILKIDHQLRQSVCRSVRTEQLGPSVDSYYEISYWNIFRNSVEKIQVSLKSDKNNG